MTSFRWVLVATYVVSAPVLGCAGEAARPAPRLIAHALGGVDDMTYTNTEDAFLDNYALGHKWFEVDLTMTADGHLVCFRPDYEDEIGLDAATRVEDITLEEFLALSFEGLTLISFEQLLQHAADDPEVTIVIDTKLWSPAVMGALLEDIDAVDPALYEQVVPQVYFPDDWPLIESTEAERGPFSARIFTLYMTQLSNAEVLDFVVEKDIEIVTIPQRENRLQPELIDGAHDVGALVFTHTLNDIDDVREMTALGIDGVYTDFVTPAEVE